MGGRIGVLGGFLGVHLINGGFMGFMEVYRGLWGFTGVYGGFPRGILDKWGGG